jgi:hypothetical protein
MCTCSTRVPRRRERGSTGRSGRPGCARREPAAGRRCLRALEREMIAGPDGDHVSRWNGGLIALCHSRLCALFHSTCDVQSRWLSRRDPLRSLPRRNPARNTPLNTLSKIAERDDISLSTLKRQIARGEGPVVIQLSPRRVGVTELGRSSPSTAGPGAGRHRDGLRPRAPSNPTLKVKWGTRGVWRLRVSPEVSQKSTP